MKICLPWEGSCTVEKDQPKGEGAGEISVINTAIMLYNTLLYSIYNSLFISLYNICIIVYNTASVIKLQSPVPNPLQ